MTFVCHKKLKRNVNTEFNTKFKDKKLSLSSVYNLEGNTEILDGPVIYVDPLSTLTLTCRVDFGHSTPEFVIWRKEDKVNCDSRIMRHFTSDLENKCSNLIVI